MPEAIHPPVADPERKLPLTSRSAYLRLEAVAIDAFVMGQHPTIASLSKALMESGNECGDTSTVTKSSVGQQLKRLRTSGLYESQPTGVGARQDADGSGYSTIYILNLGNRPVDQCTLADVVATFSSGVDTKQVPTEAESALLSALRFAFSLPYGASRETIVARCRAVDAAGIHGLPDRVYEQYREHARVATRDGGEQTAKNYRTALRRAIRYAAVQRQIPLVFPQRVEQDRWLEVADEVFPLKGASDRVGVAPEIYRHSFTRFGRAAKKVIGSHVLPDTITKAEAEQVLKHVTLVQGNLSSAGHMRAALNFMARNHRRGPMVLSENEKQFVRHTPNGVRTSLHLLHADGRADGGRWEDAVSIVETHGFPKETVDFLKWWGEWVTMTPEEVLLGTSDQPQRAARHQLRFDTLDRRGHVVRGFLAVAKDLLHLEPHELTPEQLWGEKFEEICQAWIKWWMERRDERQSNGERYGTALAGGLRNNIISMGMMALALYMKLRHGRRLKVATRTTAKLVKIDHREEEGVAKTESESAAWDAYRLSTTISNNLAAMADETREEGRRGGPEFKNLQRALENTPPKWYYRLLESLHERIRAAKRLGQDNSRDYHIMVLDAFTLGFIVSTGCRIGELCMLRLDIVGWHLSPELLKERQVRWRAFDRKNGSAHYSNIHEAALPDDVLAVNDKDVVHTAMGKREAGGVSRSALWRR